MQRRAVNILRRNAPRPADVLGANFTIDVPRELLALDENAGLEILVVLEAPEIQVRGAGDDPPQIERRQLQMVEVVLVLKDLQPCVDVRRVVVLLCIVRDLVRGPPARGDDESHLEERARPLRLEECIHDRWVIEERVLDEDRTLRSMDAVEEGLADLVRSRAWFVLNHSCRPNRDAAGRCPDPGFGALEVWSSSHPPALPGDAVPVEDDRSLEPRETVVPLPPWLRLPCFPHRGRLVVGALRRIEGQAIQVLRPKVR